MGGPLLWAVWGVVRGLDAIAACEWCGGLLSGAHYIWCVTCIQDTTGSVPSYCPQKNETACQRRRGPSADPAGTRCPCGKAGRKPRKDKRFERIFCARPRG